jgi:hypothetical protein
MRRRVAAALALAVGAAGCSGVTTGDVARTPPASPTTVSASSGAQRAADWPKAENDVADRARVPLDRRVFVVGDSLTEGAEPWLERAVTARGWTLTGVDARVGRSVRDGLAVLRRRVRTLPPTVIVALGTNNLGASAADVEAWLADARRIVGPERRVVWVNLAVAGSPGRIARGREINAALRMSARRWDVDVLDWAAWARRNGVATKSDGIHYADGAYRLRALFYAGALARPTAP